MIANQDWAMLTTPSVSLLTYSNPGFTTMKINYFAHSIATHYLDMAWYYMFKSVGFNTFDFKSNFGIDEFTVESVQKFHSVLEGSSFQTLNFMRKASGYPFYMLPVAYALHYVEGYMTLDFDFSYFICSFSTFGMNSFQQCIRNYSN